MKITGLDRLQRRLEEISRRAQQFDGASIPIDQLMPLDFMQRHTRFSSFNEFAVSGGWDGAGSLNPAWDDFVAKETTFRTWSDMLHYAAGEWSKEKIFGRI